MTELLTHSRASAYLGCHRLHWWAYECGIRPERAGDALRMGSAYHLGLQSLHHGSDVETAASVAMSAMSADDEPNRTIVGGLVAGWAWRWSEQRWHVLAFEQVFTIRSRKRWRLAGKIDAIVELEDGRQAIVEHKTTSEDLDASSDYWTRVLMDRQVAWYIAGARSLGWDPQTVIYDCARKPGIRPKLVGRGDDRCRETLEEYAQRFADDIFERPLWYYGRHEIPMLDHMVDDSLEDAGEIMSHIRASRRAGRWPRNTDHCRRWGVCPYFGPCSEGRRPDEPDIPHGYVRVQDVHVELQETTDDDHDSTT